MATISYSDYCENSKRTDRFRAAGAVEFFNSLKGDGDEAIVRFACNSVNDIDIQTVHDVQVDGKFRRVACLRESYYAPTDNCPLCSLALADPKYKVKTKAFIKLIEYTKDANGQVKASAKIWEKPAMFLKKIAAAQQYATYELAFYPPSSKLSDIVFKVVRSGAAGSKTTEYDIRAVNPAVFKPEIYSKDFSAFDGYDLDHHAYMVRTKEELEEFIKTGSFPAFSKGNGQAYGSTQAQGATNREAAEAIKASDGFEFDTGESQAAYVQPAPTQPAAAQEERPTTTAGPRRYKF